MRFKSSRFGVLAVLGPMLGYAAGAQAISCEELRSSVEAKIQSKGVKNFSVRVVEASASATGQVVGSCELGSKKLVYSQAESQASSSVKAKPPQPAVPTPKASVITECADGRVVTQGSCKR